jgi:hypothetical protein
MRAELRHRMWFGAVLLGAGLVAGACVSPKDALGTHSSPCFRALAVGLDAVHGKGHFAGVRYLSARSLAADFSREGSTHATPPMTVALTSAVCVVAYNGSFEVRSVARGWSPQGLRRGRYALVVVDARRDVVDHTIVLQRPPLQLARVFPLAR